MANPAKQLIEAGFVLSLNASGGVRVSPSSKLTPDLREFIRTNKAELIEALMAVGAQAANDGPPPLPGADLGPDRACWPHGPAMNAAEVRRMAARLRTFEAQGMPLGEAEAEADRLMHLERTRSSPAPLSAVPAPVAPPAPARRIYALPDRELDHIYLRHHWNCPLCIAAGQGRGQRCAVGLTMHMFADGGTLPMP